MLRAKETKTGATCSFLVFSRQGIWRVGAVLTVDVGRGEGVGLAVAHEGGLVVAHVRAAAVAAALRVGVDAQDACCRARSRWRRHGTSVGAPRARCLAAIPVARRGARA